MKKNMVMIGLVCLMFLMNACQIQTVAPVAEGAKATEATTEKPTETKVKGPYDDISPEILAEAQRYTENTTGNTIISKVSKDKNYRTTYMILSKDGTVVISDPYNVIPGIKADIITSSHKDYDHRDGKLSAYNKESKIVDWKVESFTEKGVTVTGIASTHYDYKIDKDRPSNVIYVYEVDGLRIAAMGDICQQALSDEQLRQLGHIDICFMMMEDASDYGYNAENSIAMLKQLKPTLVFPTHQSMSVVDQVAELFDERIDGDFKYEVTEECLTDGMTKLIVLADIVE